MKALFLSAALVLASFFTVSAQKQFKGTLTYTMEATGDVDPQQAAMMPSEIKVQANDSLVKSTMEAAFGSIVNMTNTKSVQNTTYMDIMGNKMMLSMDKSQIEEMEKKAPKMTYTATKEEKEIAGLKCKKYIATNTEDNTTSDIWVNEEYSNVSTSMSRVFTGVSGLVMEFSSNKMGGLPMKITISKVKTDAVDPKSFEVKSEGYRSITIEEARKMGMKL